MTEKQAAGRSYDMALRSSMLIGVACAALCASPAIAQVATGTAGSTGTAPSGTTMPAAAPDVRLNGGAVSPGALNNGTSIGPSAAVSTPLAAKGEEAVPLTSPEALFPKIFGLDPILRDYGTAVLLDTRNEFDGVVSGPRQGSSNSGQYGLEVDTDWEKLAGITGLSTHFLAVGRYGIPISREFGDQLNPSQEIYGAGGNVVSHMVYAYAEETLAHGAVDIAAGRNPLLDDFLASPLYCNFENNAFCGNPKASSDNGGLTSYPDAGWSLRGRVRPIPSVYVQSGIYFDQSNIYNYGENFRSGYTIDASYIDGETFPIEIGWEPAFGPNKLPGHYKAGFAYDNANHASDLYDINGNAFAVSGLAPRQVKGESTFWFLADQMLMRNGPGDTTGLILLGGYVWNSPQVSLRQQQAEVGLQDTGFWKARPLDGVNIGLSWLQVSGDDTRAEEIEQELGGLVPLNTPETSNEIPSNVGTTAENVTGLQSHTLDIEANYNVHVYRGVTFAPDFQYFIRPNAQTNLPDAALIGFISHIQFF